MPNNNSILIAGCKEREEEMKRDEGGRDDRGHKEEESRKVWPEDRWQEFSETNHGSLNTRMKRPLKEMQFVGG